MNIKQELKYAQGMVERRQEEAKTIGKAKSARQAEATYRSMAGALREVKKHYANILNAIDDSTADSATEFMGLLMTTTGWVSLARIDLVRWGLNEAEINNINREVGI
jgi:F0F1-type ATP synthase membrane subunit b/b'